MNKRFFKRFALPEFAPKRFAFLRYLVNLEPTTGLEPVTCCLRNSLWACRASTGQHPSKVKQVRQSPGRKRFVKRFVIDALGGVS